MLHIPSAPQCSSILCSSKRAVARILLAVASLLAINDRLAIAVVHDGDHPPGVRALKPAEVYAPSLLPDRIILTWAGDPTNTQSVTWRTSTEVAAGKAQIAEATPGPEFAKKAKEQIAESVALKSDLNTAHTWNEIRLPGRGRHQLERMVSVHYRRRTREAVFLYLLWRCSKRFAIDVVPCHPRSLQRCAKGQVPSSRRRFDQYGAVRWRMGRMVRSWWMAQCDDP